MSRRVHRVEDLLRSELSDLLLRGTRDPRLEGVQVVGVDLSPDLGSARVRVSTITSEHESDEVEAALAKAAGFFRSRLAGRLRHMKRVPELTFRIDRGAEHSQRIHDLLENLS